MVRFRRRLLALMVPLAVLSVLAAAAVLWLDQQSARARLAEAQLAPALARADAAEARALKAEASLTAIAQRQPFSLPNSSASSGSPKVAAAMPKFPSPP